MAELSLESQESSGNFPAASDSAYLVPTVPDQLAFRGEQRLDGYALSINIDTKDMLNGFQLSAETTSNSKQPTNDGRSDDNGADKGQQRNIDHKEPEQETDRPKEEPGKRSEPIKPLEARPPRPLETASYPAPPLDTLAVAARAYFDSPG